MCVVVDYSICLRVVCLTRTSQLCPWHPSPSKPHGHNQDSLANRTTLMYGMKYKVTNDCSPALYLQLTHLLCNRRVSRLCDKLLLPKHCFLLHIQWRRNCLCLTTCSVHWDSTLKRIPVLGVEMTVGLNPIMKSLSYELITFIWFSIIASDFHCFILLSSSKFHP